MHAEVWLEQDMRESGDLEETLRVELMHYTTDDAALEDIFATFNNHPPYEYREASKFWHNHYRSLSVGDVVVLVRPLAIGEPDLRLSYRCENVGWIRCDDPKEEI